MANLIEIPNFASKYSENIFNPSAILNDQTEVNFTGSSTSNYSFNSYKNYSYRGRSLKINALGAKSSAMNVEFDLYDALAVYQIRNTGLHIFSFGILFEDVSVFDNDLLMTLEVDLFVNSILAETFTKQINPTKFELDRYYHFAQSFNLAELDDINFRFRLSYPALTGQTCAFQINYDAFQLVFDKSNADYGSVPFYSLPIKTQITGTYDYANTLSALSFTGTPIKITNNGAGANTNILYGFSDVPNVLNVSSSFLELNALSLGDKVDVRCDLTVTTTTANQTVDVYLDVALGTATNYQIYLCRRTFKTAGTYPINDISNWIYIGNTDTRDYNTAIMFNSDANATVLNNGVAISVTKRLV